MVEPELEFDEMGLELAAEDGTCMQLYHPRVMLLMQ